MTIDNSNELQLPTFQFWEICQNHHWNSEHCGPRQPSWRHYPNRVHREIWPNYEFKKFWKKIDFVQCKRSFVLSIKCSLSWSLLFWLQLEDLAEGHLKYVTNSEGGSKTFHDVINLQVTDQYYVINVALRIEIVPQVRSSSVRPWLNGCLVLRGWIDR